jgi:hypothetical protein
MSGGRPRGSGSLSATQAEELDRACDRFEAEWRAGKRPKIEDHLEGIAAPLRSALLGDLLAVEFHWRQRRGERPFPAEYHDRLVARAPGVESSSTKADTGRADYCPLLTPETTFEAGSLGPGPRQDPEHAARPAGQITAGKPSADMQAATAACDRPPLASIRSGPAIPGYTIEGELGRGAISRSTVSSPSR